MHCPKSPETIIFGRHELDYTITPSPDGAYITLKIVGDITRKTAMGLNLEAHALGRELHINRYLVDATEARNRESILENYEFAYTDMRNTDDIDTRARIAVLVSPGDHSHDFVETVSRNAGFNMQIFTDIDQAMLFLMLNLDS